MSSVSSTGSSNVLNSLLNSASASASSASSSSSLAANIASGLGTGITSSDGINWNQLVEAAVQARMVPATNLQNKITTNTTKIGLYTQMQTNLKNLSSAAFALSSPAGISNRSFDVFAERQASISSNGTTSTSAINVTAAPGTATGSFTMQVSQLAVNQSVASAAQTGQTTALGYSGVFSIQEADGTAKNITVSTTTTLASLAASINAVSSTTKVQASVVQVSTGSYQLVLNGSNTGQAITVSSVSGDDVMQNLGVTNSSGAFANVLQAQKSAIFTYDGLTVTRSSNEVTDLVQGLTIDLAQTTGSDTMTVNIGNNLDDVAKAIQLLATQYNTYRTFALAQQSTNTDGTATSSSVLFGDSTIRNANDALYRALTANVTGSDMSLLGFKFDSTNNLTVDTTTLTNSLNNNFSAVQNLLAFGYQSSSPNLAVLSHKNSLGGTFTLNVTTDSGGNLTGASVNGDSSLFTVQGAAITGKAGTKYDGLSFVFTGSSSENIQVTTTNGLAEQVYGITNKYSDQNSGVVQQIITNLTNQDTKFQTQITDITNRATLYGQNLAVSYSKYEASIQASNSSITYLKAMLAASTSSG